jgi:hypothetical protein
MIGREKGLDGQNRELTRPHRAFSGFPSCSPGASLSLVDQPTTALRVRVGLLSSALVSMVSNDKLMQLTRRISLIMFS